MTANAKYREIVREIALDHYGYVTTREASEAGVPAVEPDAVDHIGGGHLDLGDTTEVLYTAWQLRTTQHDQPIAA